MDAFNIQIKSFTNNTVDRGIILIKNQQTDIHLENMILKNIYP